MTGTVYFINASGEKMEAWVSGEEENLEALIDAMPEGWRVKKLGQGTLQDFYKSPVRDMPIIIFKSRIGMKFVYRMVN